MHRRSYGLLSAVKPREGAIVLYRLRSPITACANRALTTKDAIMKVPTHHSIDIGYRTLIFYRSKQACWTELTPFPITDIPGTDPNQIVMSWLIINTWSAVLTTGIYFLLQLWVIPYNQSLTHSGVRSLAIEHLPDLHLESSFYTLIFSPCGAFGRSSNMARMLNARRFMTR